MRRWLPALLLALHWQYGLAADSGASDTFTSKGAELKVASATAFKGNAVLDSKDVLVVAVTNGRVNPASFADYYDRRRFHDKRVKDEEMGVVHFQFGMDGKYQDLSYHFGSGNGCGYCSGDVASTVKPAVQ